MKFLRENKKYFIFVTLIIGILMVGMLQAQTNQELDTRLKRVEDSLGITSVIIPIDTTMTLPIYEGIILNGNQDIYPLPYSPMFKDQDGYYKIFIQKGSQSFATGSLNGLNNWIYSSAGNVPRGTVIKENQNRYLCAYHELYNTKSYYRFAGSLNSYNWNDMALLREPHGEDISFIIDGGKYRAYARMDIPPAVRTIGYMESQDFRSWTPLVEVLKPDIMDGRDEFYSMSVISTERGYFGFLSVFDPLTDEMEVQLVYSVNGEDNWLRLLNRTPVLTKRPGMKQLYGIGSVIGNEVHIIAITADFGHSELDRNGRFYYTTKFKLDLEKLYKYIEQ
jgi:hypothetical protein